MAATRQSGIIKGMAHHCRHESNGLALPPLLPAPGPHRRGVADDLWACHCCANTSCVTGESGR